MLAILTITLPIFLLISTGYIARWSGMIQREQMQGVTIFVLYCALPALIIRALTQHPLEEIFQLNYLIAYGIGSLLIFKILRILSSGISIFSAKVAASGSKPVSCKI